MLLGFNTSGLQNHRLDEALRLLADCGFEAVAITPDVMHLDPFRSTARDVDAIAKLLDQLRLRPAIETGARFVLDPSTKHEPTLMTRDDDARARRIDYTRRCAALGRDLGAEVVSFFSGIDRQPGPDAEEWLRDGVRQTCDAVREAGLTPALEPEPGMTVPTVTAWRTLADVLGPAAPALCLDVGHLYVIDEGEPTAVIAGCGEQLVQVHLEDMRRGVHEHLPPGEGDVDFAGVRTALEQIGYGGAVCFELSRSSHMAPEALARCREAWNTARS